MQTISIFGCTGSIGKSACELVSDNLQKFKTNILSCQGSNLKLLEKQIRTLGPKYVHIQNKQKALAMQESFPEVKFFYEDSGLLELCGLENDVAVMAFSGFFALKYTLALTKGTKTLALANKESVICGQRTLLESAKINNCKIIPVDSEHNSIYRLIYEGEKRTSKNIRKIYITASGGPFLNRALNTFQSITPKEASFHPNWSMGVKISVDSATMMNKALELCEAKVLFEEVCNSYEILLHPQSIVHAIVQTKDNACFAFFSKPDMKIHIQHAIFNAQESSLVSQYTEPIDFTQVGNVQFLQIDEERFPSVKIAKSVCDKMGPYAIAMNASNEVAVEAFTSGQISFTKITNIVEEVLQKTKNLPANKEAVGSIEDITSIDKESRRLAKSFISSDKKVV